MLPLAIVNQTASKLFKPDIFKQFNPKIKLPPFGGTKGAIVGAAIGGAIGLGYAINQYMTGDLLSDVGEVSQSGTVTAPGEQNKTRSRFKRYSTGRCRPVKYTSRKRYRHSNTCRH